MDQSVYPLGDIQRHDSSLNSITRHVQLQSLVTASVTCVCKACILFIILIR